MGLGDMRCNSCGHNITHCRCGGPVEAVSGQVEKEIVDSLKDAVAADVLEGEKEMIEKLTQLQHSFESCVI